MPSSYSARLRLENLGNGEQVGSWGDTTDRNICDLLEQAIAGSTRITMVDADYTLTAMNGAVDEARSQILILEGTLSAVRSVVIPSVSKTYIVANKTFGDQAIQIKTITGIAANIPADVTAHVYCDGFDTYLIASNQTTTSGTVTSITAQAPLTGGTITGAGTIGLATIPTLTPGTYGNSSNTPTLTVDAYGRITSIAQVSIAGGGGSGVTSISTGSGLTGGPITSSGTISLASSGVGAGTYGSSTLVPVLTVDGFGRITGASTSAISGGTSISNTGGSVSCTTTGVTITSINGVTINPTGNNDVTINGDLNATGQISFGGNSLMVINADTISTNGTTRWGSGSQEFKVGGDSTANAVTVSTSGSNIRGIGYTSPNLYIGRGVVGGDSNALLFAGDTSGAGTATFTVTTVYKTGGGQFTATSDERLKNIHGPYSTGLSAIVELQPVEFDYKDKPDKVFVGLIAQKIQHTPFASMVGKREDGYLTLDTSELIYALINSVKELNFRLTQLEVSCKN